MNKKNILIIVLLVLVIVLTGYIFYDKVLSKDNKMEEQSQDKIINKENLVGTYKYEGKKYSEDNIDYTFSRILVLKNDLTFEYTYKSDYDSAKQIGTYSIQGDTLIIVCNKEISEQCSNESDLYTINDDGSLTNEYQETLKKTDNNEEITTKKLIEYLSEVNISNATLQYQEKKVNLNEEQLNNLLSAITIKKTLLAGTGCAGPDVNNELTIEYTKDSTNYLININACNQIYFKNSQQTTLEDTELVKIIDEISTTYENLCEDYSNKDQCFNIYSIKENLFDLTEFKSIMEN